MALRPSAGRLFRSIKQSNPHPLLNSRPFHVLANTSISKSSRASRTIHTTAALRNKKDHYEVLGVSKNSTKDEIKKAFYKLAKQYHPDVNKGDKESEKRFAEVSAAWDVLSDDKKKSAYDSFGHDAERMGGFDGQNPFAGGFQGAAAEQMFRDIFGNFAGGQAGFGGFGGEMHKGPTRGADISTTFELDFMEAVNGTSKLVKFPRKGPCGTCNGSGDKAGDKAKCKACGGRGFQSYKSGPYDIQTPCGSCKGSGKQSCDGCKGTGTVKETGEVQVKFPAGISSSSNVRVANQGHSGTNGGPRGHLWVQCQVGPHPDFRRDGTNIYVHAPISFTTAALGGSVIVPTLAGTAQVQVSAGTQPNDQRVLRGKGIKILNQEKYGHQYVTFQVEVPKNLTAKQIELLKQFKAEGEATPAVPFASPAVEAPEEDDEAPKSGKKKSWYSRLFEEE